MEGGIAPPLVPACCSLSVPIYEVIQMTNVLLFIWVAKVIILFQVERRMRMHLTHPLSLLKYYRGECMSVRFIPV